MKNQPFSHEIFSSQNRKSLQFCLFHGKVDHSFDQTSRGYIINLNAASLQIPRNNRESLQLVHPFIVFQFFIHKNKPLTIELTTSDSQSIKRRLVFTHGRKVIKNPLHARIPHTIIERGVWLNLFFNIESLFAMCFSTLVYRSLESVSLTGTCIVRRIFTLQKLDPYQTIPIGCEMPPGSNIKQQTIDAVSFQETPRPVFFSNSPPRGKKYLYKDNPSIFRNLSVEKEIKDLKEAYLRSVNTEKKALFPRFRRKEQKELDEERYKVLSRKITHNYTRPAEPSDDIEEKIEVDAPEVPIDTSAWINIINADSPTDKFKEPKFFENQMSIIMQMRHFTPPFVNVTENVEDGQEIRYNPKQKCYESI
ncbi:unnamed protein product [Blepharisma stoltei]|uniref:CFA20 domain-containing protein n=1 Tax=Blepharisma stoltei TaxID=1481888 RepID=A0AAU9JT65_9CILI|nr:unnamed protein product [Blepharisma stoltei]